ncbi:MAG: NAD(P)H-dependent oxidoreductase [Nitrospirae bacterium]|nr:NAD(P)H-dependent oxidoreductase [Nitrospirota bacterium]
MAKLLYICASPMGERSYSTRAADAFVAAYRKAHTGDTVETLNLWKADLPEFDLTTASGKYAILHGKSHSAEEAAAWQGVVKAIDHFKSFDKYLISSPMWNFGLPYRLKHYLDIIIQPGLTFSFDPATGYTGLVTGKPVMLVLARGGEYPAGTPAAAYDHQRPYLELLMGFIGFTDIRAAVIEPTLAGPDKAEASLAAAVASLAKAAEGF